MIGLSLLFFFLQAPETTAQMIAKIAASGHVVEIVVPPSERIAPPIRIAPGPPPLIGFRKLDGEMRHRFGDLDLVVDDAGH